MTRPMSGSLPVLGRREEPSLGQKRSPVSYSDPHCGQTLATATVSCFVGVGCCARRPDPNALVPSALPLSVTATFTTVVPGSTNESDFGWTAWILDLARFGIAEEMFAKTMPCPAQPPRLR